MIEKNRLQKAEESLDYILYWFDRELNPLERDLIRYFQGNIYYLQKRYNLAIVNYTSTLHSRIDDSEIIETIKLQLSKLHIDREEYLTALKYLNDLDSSDEVIKLRFLSYRLLENYSKAYDHLQLFLDGNSSIEYWDSWIDLSKRMGIDIRTIETAELFNSINSESRFREIYQLLSKNRMEHKVAQLIEYGFNSGLNIEGNLLVEAVDIYSQLLEFNRLEKFLETLLVVRRDNFFLYRLAIIKFENGEFEKSLQLLDEVAENGNFEMGLIYLQRGEIYYLQKRFHRARDEWLKAFHQQGTHSQASSRLKLIKEKI